MRVGNRKIGAAVATAAVCMVTLVGCGTSEDSGTGDGQASESQDKPQDKPKSECLKVPAEKLAAIAEGGKDATLVPVAGAAVKSKDFEKVFMIAMRFDGLGSTEEGVWASNSLKPGHGLLMAVDGMAQEFTVWPNGPADSPMSITNHGAEEALGCL